MRKWGIVISLFYALILLVIIVPGSMFLEGGDSSNWPGLLRGLKDSYTSWMFWILAGTLVAAQALLLFLSVDTSQKRLKPQTHILISCIVVALLTAILTSAVVWSLGVAVRGDKFFDLMDNFAKNFIDSEDYVAIFLILIFWGTLWLFWSILFYLYFRNSSAVITRLISWLLKGSVLQLLIVVLCHVIVRRRHDCSAPVATSFGIAAGIAIMLLSFGPSVLFLYKKRLDSYASHSTP